MTAKTSMSNSSSSRWGNESQTPLVVSGPNYTYHAPVLEEENEDEEVAPPPVLAPVASGATMGSARSHSPMPPTRRPSLGAGEDPKLHASNIKYLLFESFSPYFSFKIIQ